MLAVLQLLLGAIRFMLGAALYSFINVVAYRLPRGKSIAKGHSECPKCGAMLTAPDLVPVFSWLLLGGKCRHCGAPIAVRYLLMELFGGALALGCTAKYGAAVYISEGFFGMSYPALLALALLGVLTAIALIDAETQTIPDSLNIAIGVCGVLSAFIQPEIGLVSRIIGAVCISLPMLLLCMALEGAFGGGDIKLMLAAGFYLGWQNTLVAAFLAVLTGGVYGIYLLAAKKKEGRDHFAFGPFLCSGIALAMFFGNAILSWYLQFF